MKIRPANSGRLVLDCVALVALQAVFLQVLARTHLLEKLMAAQFNRWELGVILLFVVLRLAAYFLVPAFLAALLTWKIFGRIGTGARR